jgi:O-antigen ligase
MLMFIQIAPGAAASQQGRRPFSPAWLGIWAMGLSITWLLPNHFPPWTTFHSDAWVALLLLPALVAVFLVPSRSIGWRPSAWVVLALLPLLWLQFMSGMIPFAGDAWMAGAYLLGLGLALMTGAHWESLSPGQALDGLALAFGVAGLLSVGLQLIQWLDIGGSWQLTDLTAWQLWVIESSQGRPYANLGQPNLLATLLLLSVLSAAWGVVRGKIGPFTAVLLIAYLLFGVALTRSRTAWLGVGLLVAASWYWSRLWPNRSLPVLSSVLGLFFAGIAGSLVLGADWSLEGGAPQLDTSRLDAGQRPVVWRLLAEAALAKPWWGYGWNQTQVAYLSLVNDYPALHSTFDHAHNLFLELLLWCGIPIGLLLSGLVVLWCVRCFRRVRTAGDAVALLMIVIVGMHAMLELPLHHAYFLFPVGVVAGVLEQRIGVNPVLKTGRTPMLVLGASAALCLGLTVRDYMGAIEQDFRAMRFESARVGIRAPSEAPDVVVLTQLRELLRYWRYLPRSGMSEQDIEWARTVTQRNPVPGTLFKLAQILAINGQASEAERWLRTTRKVVPVGQWKFIERVWLDLSKAYPAMAAVRLPSPD